MQARVREARPSPGGGPSGCSRTAAAPPLSTPPPSTHLLLPLHCLDELVVAQVLLLGIHSLQQLLNLHQLQAGGRGKEAIGRGEEVSLGYGGRSSSSCSISTTCRRVEVQGEEEG